MVPEVGSPSANLVTPMLVRGGNHRKFGNGRERIPSRITLDRVGEIGHPTSGFRQDGAMCDDGEVFVNGGERGRPVLGKLSPVGKESPSRTSGGGNRRRQSVQVKESDHCSDSETDEFLSRKNVVTSAPEYRSDVLILQAEVSALQDRCRYELEQLPDDIRKPLVSDYDKEDERFLSMPVLTNERDRLQGTAKRYHKRMKEIKRAKQVFVNYSHGVQLNYSSEEDEVDQIYENVIPSPHNAVFVKKNPEQVAVNRPPISRSPDSDDEVRAVREELRRMAEQMAEQRQLLERMSNPDTVQDRDSNPKPLVVPSPGSPDHIREVVAQTMESQLSVVMEQQQLLLGAKLSAMMEQQQLLLQRAVVPNSSEDQVKLRPVPKPRSRPEFRSEDAAVNPVVIQDPVKETRARSLMSPEISDRIKSLEEENLSLREKQRSNDPRSVSLPVIEDQVLISGLRSSVSTDLTRKVETLEAEFLKMQNESQLSKSNVINPLVVQSQSSNSGLRPSVPTNPEVVETPEAELLRLREENKRFRQNPGTPKGNRRDHSVLPSELSVSGDKPAKPCLKSYPSSPGSGQSMDVFVGSSRTSLDLSGSLGRSSFRGPSPGREGSSFEELSSYSRGNYLGNSFEFPGDSQRKLNFRDPSIERNRERSSSNQGRGTERNDVSDERKGDSQKRYSDSNFEYSRERSEPQSRNKEREGEEIKSRSRDTERKLAYDEQKNDSRRKPSSENYDYSRERSESQDVNREGNRDRSKSTDRRVVIDERKNSYKNYSDGEFDYSQELSESREANRERDRKKNIDRSSDTKKKLTYDEPRDDSRENHKSNNREISLENAPSPERQVEREKKEVIKEMA